MMTIMALRWLLFDICNTPYYLYVNEKKNIHYFEIEKHTGNKNLNEKCQTKWHFIFLQN